MIFYSKDSFILQKEIYRLWNKVDIKLLTVKNGLLLENNF